MYRHRYCRAAAGRAGPGRRGGLGASAEGGYVVIMRHALTDLPRAKTRPVSPHDDCATQRNLSPRASPKPRPWAPPLQAGRRHRRGLLEPLLPLPGHCLAGLRQLTRCGMSSMATAAPALVGGLRLRAPAGNPQALVGPVGGPGNRIIVTHNTHIKALTDLWGRSRRNARRPAPGRMFFTVVGRLRVEDY